MPARVEDSTRCDCRYVGRTGCCRGGYREGKHTKPVRGPAYRRIKEFPRAAEGFPEAWDRSDQYRWHYEKFVKLGLANGTLSPTDVAVALTIAGRADKQGRNSFMLRRTIGGLVKVKPRSVTSSTGRLVRTGWLAKIHRSRSTDQGLRGRSNTYQLMMPPEFEQQVPRGEPLRNRRRRQRNSTNRRPVDRVTQPEGGTPERVGRGPDQTQIDLWKAALATKSEAEQQVLARAEGLPDSVVNKPGPARTSALAVALCESRGPP